MPDQNVFKNVAAATLRDNDSKTTSRRIEELLKKGLNPNDAVTIALLNNRELQAKFARIGLTQAQIQGSLPENPAAGTTLIVDGHDSLSYEAHFSHNLASVLHATRQRATLRHQLAAEHKLAATEVMRLALNTRKAYHAFVAALAKRELQREIMSSEAAAQELTKRLDQAGNITKLDFMLSKSQFETAKLKFSEFENAVVRRKEALNRLMGLWGEQTNWQASTNFDELKITIPKFGKLESAVVDSSLELSRISDQIRFQSAQVGLARQRAWLPNFSVGWKASNDNDIAHNGPMLGFTLPLFSSADIMTGMAQVRLQQLENIYYSKAVEIRSFAREKAFQVATLREQTEVYEAQIVPLSRSIVDFAQLEYNGMQIGLFKLVAYKKAQFEHAIQFINRRLMLNNASLELAAAINGYVDVSSPPPQTMPAMTQQQVNIQPLHAGH
ncbi:MAG: TolC family protein [Myxococcota bacterium]|nr:TolC family protein [Myxococcota bacterium]